MYVIRADGNERTGAGHLMRCLTVAEALAKEAGGREEILFFCADELSAAMVRARGFEVRVFHTDYRHLEQELPLWDKIGIIPDVILIDSYFVTEGYLRELGKRGVTILLDDLQNRSYPVDGVINYNVYAEQAVYQKLYEGTNTRCYVGGDYVPLRPQFTGCAYEMREQVRDVMITVGGGDAGNITGDILQALGEEEQSRGERREICYHLVVGGLNPHLRRLEGAAAGNPLVVLHRDVRDMAGLMSRCDLAVTAGGTTVYELAAVGVPFICFSWAENQERLTAYVESRKIAGFAGAYHRDKAGTTAGLRKLFSRFCGDYKLRYECYLKERKLIDGQGAGRIAGVLKGLGKKA